MDPMLALLSAIVGYLLGSLSFARIITRLVAPQVDISQGIVLDVPGAEEKMRVEAVAGTAVASQLGDRYGGLTGILDIAKVAIPTFVFRLAFPEMPYFLITAAMGLVGHNWPLYHRFKGGRGLSAIYGGFFVIDWIGTLVTAIVALVLGLTVLKSVLVAYLGGLWLMIPWLWFRTHDPAYLAYVIFVNIIFGVAMIPDIRVMMDRKRRGIETDFEMAMESTPMGRGLRRMGKWLGLRKKEG